MNTHHADPDTSHAVEIANRIWWVGHYLKDDVFQCHVYLIENGDQSVLFDPGSELTFSHTLKKIEEVIPFSNIRYFVCHHQDPDITACLPKLDAMIDRDDAVLVTHWRVAVLLKHYGLKHLAFWQIEDHDWKLDIGERQLNFIFTPYMHFPGAFCTFDQSSGVLFSSDIFGGFTEDWSLYARDEGYFESMRPFHEHYMPSQDILVHGMLALEAWPIRIIAPQHGSIIPPHLTQFMINKLKTLECGLYLMTKKDSDIRRLMKLNKMVRTISSSLLNYRDFRQVAEGFRTTMQDVLPLKSLEFYVHNTDDEIVYLTENNRYHGEKKTPPEDYIQLLSCHNCELSNYQKTTDADGNTVLLIRLIVSEDSRHAALAILSFSEKISIGEEFDNFVAQLSVPLAIAVEREAIYRALETERDIIYERSIRDPLTGLYTRHYMQETVHRMIMAHARDKHANFTLVMVDIDFFKAVNDTYGHQTGDTVLKSAAEVLLAACRDIDVPVRFGGEEFSIFLSSTSIQGASTFAQRIRIKVNEIAFTSDDKEFHIAISSGIAAHHADESLEDLMKRADMALYQAKKTGRNKVCIDASDDQ